MMGVATGQAAQEHLNSSSVSVASQPRCWWVCPPWSALSAVAQAETPACLIKTYRTLRAGCRRKIGAAVIYQHEPLQPG